MFFSRSQAAQLELDPNIAIFLRDTRLPLPDTLLEDPFIEKPERPVPTPQELAKEPDMQVMLEAARMILEKE